MLESVQRWMAKKKKTRKKNREILCGSPNCLHPREQGKKIFTMLKLGLHKMIFILTLRNEIPKILLNHTLVPLRFAPAFCPFFSICLFAQIWATYYNKPHWYCEILMGLIFLNFIKSEHHSWGWWYCPPSQPSLHW